MSSGFAGSNLGGPANLVWANALQADAFICPPLSQQGLCGASVMQDDKTRPNMWSLVIRAELASTKAWLL